MNTSGFIPGGNPQALAIMHEDIGAIEDNLNSENKELAPSGSKKSFFMTETDYFQPSKPPMPAASHKKSPAKYNNL